MNAQFYSYLTQLKTLSNASFLESIKDIYLKSEQKAQFESIGAKEDDRGEVYFENGSVRCTRTPEGIIVEASATGTKNMYAVVGLVSTGTPLNEAVAAGKAALDNDAVMAGVFDWMKRGESEKAEGEQ